MSTGSGSISQSVSYSQDQVFEKMFYRTQTGAPLCESCATCRTCMPVVHKQQQPCSPDYNTAQNIAKQQPTKSLPRQFINRHCSNFDYLVQLSKHKSTHEKQLKTETNHSIIQSMLIKDAKSLSRQLQCRTRRHPVVSRAVPQAQRGRPRR